jgi:poly(U)-specific endoribonuclease
MNDIVILIGIEEHITREELKEDFTFLNLIMDTAVMQYTHQYLLLKGLTHSRDRTDFIKELYRLWFALYTRQVKNDSSGFEHVFLGEIKHGVEIIGFHNWIRIYLEEKKGKFNYLGYIKSKPHKGHWGSDLDEHKQLITMQFEWSGAKKLFSSSFIGTSPEFEFALYTLCFYAGQEENTVQVGPYRVLLTCYKFPPHPKPGQEYSMNYDE